MNLNKFIVFRSLTLLRLLALDASLIGDEYAGLPSTKLDALFEQLEDVVVEGHRALIFSQFTSYLAKVERRLDAAGIDYVYLDGSTRHRAGVIQEFKSGTAPVFLISLKAGGFGLNLTETDYVFLLDPWWNPASEEQAIDRTHRIGQDKNVMVYRLVAADTIEEKVLALQKRKAGLFDAVIDDQALFSAALTADDLRELLSWGETGPDRVAKVRANRTQIPVNRDTVCTAPGEAPEPPGHPLLVGFLTGLAPTTAGYPPDRHRLPLLNPDRTPSRLLGDQLSARRSASARCGVGRPLQSIGSIDIRTLPPRQVWIPSPPPEALWHNRFAGSAGARAG